MRKAELIEQVQNVASEGSMKMSRAEWIDVCDDLENFFSAAAAASRCDEENNTTEPEPEND